MIRTLENDILKLDVSDIGAEVKSLVKKSTGREYLFDANPDWWKNTAPICFPVCGRFADGKYTVDGEEYEMIVHGIFRSNPTECVYADSTKVIHKRSADDEFRKHFPFEFDFFVTHELLENKVKVGYKVVNKDRKVMPFQVGGHTGFAAKLGDKISLYGSDRAEYRLLENNRLTEEKQVIGSPITLSEDTYKNGALYFTDSQVCGVGLSDEKGEYLRLSFCGFPVCVLWSPAGAPFTCIEPWLGSDDKMGADDDLRKRYLINNLLPGEEFEISWYITVM